VLTAFLGLNSLTGNEPNTTITTTSSQLSQNQDLPLFDSSTKPEVSPVVKQSSRELKAITAATYSDHMELSVAQLETVALMLSVLDQADTGLAPTE
jgi:hypothetical protein